MAGALAILDGLHLLGQVAFFSVVVSSFLVVGVVSSTIRALSDGLEWLVSHPPSPSD